MADPSLFQDYMNRRTLKTPAFNFVPGIGFQPTQQTQAVVNLLNQKSGKFFDLQPANSVMATNGIPMWGRGEGVVYHDDPKKTNTGYVDPLAGTVHTVAHEGAHAVFPSSLQQVTVLNATNNKTNSFINPLFILKDTGQRLRWAHETFGKPSLVEETHAQGVADAVLKKLNIPYESSIPEYQSHPLMYPSTYVGEGIEQYAKNEMGPPSPYERREVKRIFNASQPLMERVFKQGSQLIN